MDSLMLLGTGMTRRELAIFLSGLAVPALAHPRRAAFAALGCVATYYMVSKPDPPKKEPTESKKEEPAAEAAAVEEEQEEEDEGLIALASTMEWNSYHPDVEHLACIIMGSFGDQSFLTNWAARFRDNPTR